MKDLRKAYRSSFTRSERKTQLARIIINEETGEHLIAGMGKSLGLRSLPAVCKRDNGVEIVTSSTESLVYRETVAKPPKGTVEGKSPNRHNRFFMSVEPMPETVLTAIQSGKISMNMENDCPP